jgi:hypothetical protein
VGVVARKSAHPPDRTDDSESLSTRANTRKRGSLVVGGPATPTTSHGHCFPSLLFVIRRILYIILRAVT